MIIDFIFLTAIIACFFFSGVFIKTMIRFPFPLQNDKTLTILLGQGAIFLIAFLVVLLKFDTKNIFYLSIFFSISGILIIIQKRLLLNLVSVVKSGFAIFSIIPAMIVLIANNNTFFEGKVRFRNGPDIFGWITSAQYLCTGNTIADLSKDLLRATKSTNLGEVFSPSPLDSTMERIPLNQIPSVRSQYAGEFLVGNNRLGLPGFQSAICRVFDNQSIFHTSNALSALSIILICVISHRFIRRFHLSNHASIFYSLLAACNFGVLSVLFEGGIGQLITIPHFLLLVYYLTDRPISIRHLLLALAASMALSFSTYSDVKFIIFLMFSAFIFFKYNQMMQEWKIVLKNRHYVEKKGNFADFLKTELRISKSYGVKLNLVGSTLLILFFMELLRNFLYRFGSSGIRGGWDFGRFPNFVNIVGVVDWIPKDGRTGLSKSVLVYFIEFSVTFVCYKLYKESRGDHKVVLRSIFVCLIAIGFVNYANVNQAHNSYALWKLGGYLSPLFWIYMSPRLSSSEGKISTKRKFTGYIVVIAGVISLITWSLNYAKHSQISYGNPSSTVVRYINDSDIYFRGTEGLGAGSAAFVSLGDVHFLNPGRQRSSPKRPLIYFTLKGVCDYRPESVKSCLRKEFGLQKHEELELVEVAPPFMVYKMRQFESSKV
jgi:hypothetical protein